MNSSMSSCASSSSDPKYSAKYLKMSSTKKLEQYETYFMDCHSKFLPESSLFNSMTTKFAFLSIANKSSLMPDGRISSLLIIKSSSPSISGVFSIHSSISYLSFRLS